MISSTDILAIQQQWHELRASPDRLEWELGMLFIGINFVTCWLTTLGYYTWYCQRRDARLRAIEHKQPASIRVVQEIELLKMGQSMTELLLASIFILAANGLCWALLTDENTNMLQAALDNWYLLFLPWIGLYAFILLYSNFKQLNHKLDRFH